jgi:peptidoglycan/LPS O-acetylase OafA/YrhL
MTPESPRGRIRYIPALDGIRGLLLPGVILVHYALFLGNRPGVPGWLHHVGLFTLNIQMFFVLSGALITSLLVAEHQRSGAVSMKQFYLRRSRRLGPALVTALPLMALAALVWSGSTSSGPLGPHPWLALGAVSVFLGNWMLFRVSGGIGWLGPAWTLGIEEQFYLTWPLLLRSALRRGLRRTTVLAGFAASAVVAIAIAALTYRHYGPTRTYYASFTQLPSLIAGCALGYELTVNPDGRFARLTRSRAVGVGGLVGVVLASYELAHHTRYLYRGGYLVYAFVACLLVGHCFVTAADTTIVSRVLGWRPFVVMGQVSYEAYLIHVIVIIAVADAVPNMHAGPMIILDSAIVAALSLSFFYLVEQPIRRDGWRRFFGGLARPVHALRAAYPGRPFAVAGGLLAGAAALVLVGGFIVTGGGSGSPSSGSTPPTAVQAAGGPELAPPVVGVAVAPPNSGTLVASPGVSPAIAVPPASGALLSDPRIVAVSPSDGPLRGGEQVALRGTHLDQVSRVMFGDVAASSFAVESPSKLVAIAPATTQVGAVPIRVFTAGSQVAVSCSSGCIGHFAYLAVPTITRLMPASGSILGGTHVTVHGTGFAQGVRLYLGALQIPVVQRINATTLSFVVPAAHLVDVQSALRDLHGLQVSVTVRTDGGTSTIGLPSLFTYL